jgi:radical SAM superfamily enzyme YgiQ (UPF0313 family)
MDCPAYANCGKDCLSCPRLDKSHKKLLTLMKKARAIDGIKHIYIRSGIRYDLCPPAYTQELARHHVYDTLRIAPEHVSKNVLRLMNKDHGDLGKFIREFSSAAKDKKLSYYFMAAHPGSTMKEAEELALALSKLENIETIQLFTLRR